MSEDNPLRDVDLSAWEVPPPSDRLADVVVARMGATEAAIAASQQRARRPWLVGGVAVAVIAIAGGAWLGLRDRDRTPIAADGALVADRPRHLALDDASGELDAGADVRWHHQAGALRVEQRAGTVAWKVGAEQRLVIDAGATGASVEASGASLRVEINMNVSDARVITAAAATSAAVALATVVVYEGHVKVTDHGQTVIVEPGSTYRVTNDPSLVVGVAPPDRTAPAPAPAGGKASLAILGLETIGPPAPVARELTEGLRARAKVGTGAYHLAPGSDKELVDEKLLVNCATEAPACMAAIGDDLGADALLYGHVEAQHGTYAVTIKLLDVQRKTVARAASYTIPAGEAQGAALQGWAKRVYAGLTGPLEHDTDTSDHTIASDDSCDEDALKTEGRELESTGAHAAALAKFEASYACQAEPATAALALMAACNGTLVAKARRYYGLLPADRRAQVAQMCTRRGITVAQLEGEPAGCDALALKKQGEERIAQGQFDAALAKLEASLACKDDPNTPPLAFLAACRAKNVAKARLFYGKLSGSDRTKLRYACVNEGITADQLEGTAAAPACNAETLVSQGRDAEAQGAHAAALAKFEAALRCKPDETTRALAFMAACNSANIAKARVHYRKMTPEHRARYAPMCTRRGITRAALDDTQP